jgi:hypothetical protein
VEHTGAPPKRLFINSSNMSEAAAKGVAGAAARLARFKLSHRQVVDFALTVP